MVGALGQGCFFARVLVQWIVSEKRRRSASPRAYWWLSLVAAALLAATAVALEEWVLLPGYFITSAVYGRNLAVGRGGGRLGPLPAALLGLGAGLALILWGLAHGETSAPLAPHWIAIGIAGQAIWSTRFLLQWWFSERAGVSHFPPSFWWLSLVGSVLNLLYTLQLDSPVFWVGFALAWFVPLRNLMLEGAHRRGARGACPQEH